MKCYVRRVLMSDYGMVMYYTTKYDFPVTNHNLKVNEENIGWIRGIMSDDLPFEAEKWQKGKEVDVCFIIPAIYSEDDDINPYDTTEKEKLHADNKENGISGFKYEVDMWDGGILAIGMVDEGYEEDPFVLQNYVEILENNGLIEYTSDLYNGYVQYVVDVAGNEFARIVVTLEDENGFYASCPLFFERFRELKNRQRFKVVK